MYNWYAATALFLKAHHALLYDDDDGRSQQKTAIEQDNLTSAMLGKPFISKGHSYGVQYTVVPLYSLHSNLMI